MNSPLVDNEPVVTYLAVQEHDVNRTSILEKGIEKESSESSSLPSQRYILQIESDHEQNDNNNNNCYLPPTSIDASGCLPPGDLVDNTNDDDDPEPATNYVFEYLKYYKEDLFWSFLSDVCFLMGSVLYLSISYYEVQGGGTPRFCYILDIMAPLLYLLNSAMDIQWALLVQRRPKRHPAEVMTGLWRTNTGLPPPLMSPSFTSSQTSNDSKPAADRQPPPADHNDPTSSTLATIVSSRSRTTWWRRLFRYAAHRRTLCAAGSFGLAALLSVIAVLLEYEPVNSQQKDEASTTSSSTSNEEHGRGIDIIDALSDHVYVISAVIALTGRRVRPWFYTGGKDGGNNRICAIFHEPEVLEDMGDILFLMGCLFDAMLDDLAMQTIPLLGAVSSLLWCVDALLYLRSDFIMSRRLRNSDLSAQLV
jgi:hypothetical protein